MEEKQVNQEEEVEEMEVIDEEEIEVLEDASEANQADETEDLRAENEKLADRLLRLQAEYENFKRRTTKERIAEREYKSQELVTELLPVLDNFERALQTEVSAENQSFKDGVQMVYDQLTNALQSQGVEAIAALHEPFDPNLHHAVMQISDPDQEANIVVEELQKGYTLKDKVIRPTMVKVNQ